jgi:ligand-binding sensor domain-containing protein
MNWRILKKTHFVLILSVFVVSCENYENAIDPGETNTWKTFDTKSGLASNKINSIFTDSKGNIWACTTDRGVCRYDGKSWRTFNTSDGLLSNMVLTGCEDGEGNIWFGTSDGINLLDGNEWYYLTGFSHYVQSVISNYNGEIMAGTWGDGLFIVDRNYNIFPIVFNGQTFSNINTIYESKNRHFWIGTDNGVAEMMPQSAQLNYKCNYFKKANGLASDTVNSITQDKWDNFWFGHTGNRYLTKFDGSNFNQVLMPVPFGVTIYSILSTSNDLWIGSFGAGILRYDGAFFYPVTQSAGVAGNFISYIISDKTGNIWVGAYGNGISKYIP